MTNQAENDVQAAIEEPRRLRRSRHDRLVAGVCGGLAEYFGLNAAVYRIIFVALTLVGGTGLLLYAAAALVMPVEGSDESLAAQGLREHRDRPWLVIGLGLLVLAGVFFLSGPQHVFWPVAGGIWLLALVAGGLIVWWEVSHRDPQTTGAGDVTLPAARARDTRPSLFWPGLGLLIAAGGVLGLLDALDAVDVNWGVALAAGGVVAGILVALGFLWRGAAGLALLAIPLLLAMGAALALDDVSLRGGVGDRLERPVLAADLQRDYRLGIGDLEVDLRDLELPPGETKLTAHVGIGELVVDLPANVAVSVTGSVRGGDMQILGRERDGWRVRDRVVDPSFAEAKTRLLLDATVGFGDVEVRRP